MRQVYFAMIIGFIFSTIYALTPAEIASLKRDCAKIIAVNVSPLRKETSKIKTAYKILREKEIASDAGYQQLNTQKSSVEDLIASQGSTDSLQAILSSVSVQMIALRDSIPVSDTLQTIQGVIDTKTAVMDTLKQQVIATSSVCQQAYGGQ